MTALDDLTVMILTRNEANNIERTLDAVNWVKSILVVDSGSSDETLEIVARYPQAIVARRDFDSFANQCNFGLSRIRTSWVLSMDADYVVSAELSKELQELTPDEDIAGFSAKFRYLIHGRPLAASLYPPRCVLYRVDGAQYHDEGHGHRVSIKGKVGELKSFIYHDDRKPLSRWTMSQINYAEREADYLLSTPVKQLRLADRLRLSGWVMPLLVPLYALLWKRCAFVGRAGWYYALQRLFAETAIALEILDRRLVRAMKTSAGRDPRPRVR